ncbi:hypothetical protein CRN47_23120 [Vibrio vulnificus]|nr:hypothetical protein CRN33_20785 [Vibrio vulnificus]POB20150.1 hypothetical protein CRN47_23120 [Vibrio vulnificus]
MKGILYIDGHFRLQNSSIVSDHNKAIPFLLEAAAVLAMLVHWHASPAQSHSLSMFMGMTLLAAYLQLQVVWVYHTRE